MKWLLVLFLTLAVARGDEQRRQIGASLDGRYVVSLAAEHEDDLPTVHIFDTKTNQHYATEVSDGYWSFRSAQIGITWREDMRMVAFDFRTTKTSSAVMIYHLGEKGITAFKFPDFVASILGRQGVVAFRKNQYNSFGEFLPDNQCRLSAYVEPDNEDKLAADPIDGFRPSIARSFEVVLQLDGSGMEPYARLLSLKPTKEEK